LLQKPKPKLVKRTQRIKPKQRIPRTYIELIKNKKAIESSIKRLEQTERYIPIKDKYNDMLSVFTKSEKEINDISHTLKNMTSSSGLSHPLSQELTKLTFYKNDFLKSFNKFVNHSIKAQNNPERQAHDFIWFSVADMHAQNYKSLKEKIITSIMKTKSK